MGISQYKKHPRLLVLYAATALVVIHFCYWAFFTPGYTPDPHYVNKRTPLVTEADVAQDVRYKSNSGPPVKATFVTVCTDSELYSLLETLQDFETRFNHIYHYDWVFLTDGFFSPKFKRTVQNVLSGGVTFGYIERMLWSFPRSIDPDKAHLARAQMVKANLPYGGSIEFRNRARYMSGFLYNHTALQDYDYYWSVSPGAKLTCDVNYDVFKLMKDHKKKYGFITAGRGDKRAYPTIFDQVDEFQKQHPELINDEVNNAKFIEQNKYDATSEQRCEFDTSFEIGDLSFFRGEAYQQFFQHLDSTGGFHYERWSESIVKTIAASKLLRRDELHFFNDLGYHYDNINVCPIELEVRDMNKCICDPTKSVTWNPRKFCLHKYFLVNGLERPLGWNQHMNRDL